MTDTITQGGRVTVKTIASASVEPFNVLDRRPVVVAVASVLGVSKSALADQVVDQLASHSGLTVALFPMDG